MVSIVLKTLFEAALFGFVVWALFNEDKFIAFEDKLFAAVRRSRLKVRRGSLAQPRCKIYQNR